ncbi:MAG: WhiB family transcriptional regulator [Actinomycetia bacterium]|nr:WhiB family transcriptional regulator [Actinomycetes bacterium]
MSTVDGLDWQKRAVCYLETSDAPEMWTPERRPQRGVREQLEQMCQRCPVRRRCATEAFITEAESGIYAGVWVPERKDNSPRDKGHSWLGARERLRTIAATAPVAIAMLGASA